MRIVLVCNEYPPQPHGGIGTFVHCLAHGLADAGQSITVVGFGEIKRQFNDGDVRVVSLTGSKMRFVGNLISRMRLRAWLISQSKAGQVDLVETPEYMGMLPFGAGNCLVVVRLHLADTLIRSASCKPESKGIKYYERRTLSSNQNWIAVSEYIQILTQKTFGVFPNRCRCIYNAVAPPCADSTVINGAPARFILYASALSRRKGALVLAEAARSILEENPDLHLVYVGGIANDERGIDGTILSVLGPRLATRVHFVGQVIRPIVLAWMRRAAVFVFPSNLESFGLVVLEAMQMGAPVVCTSLGPGPEIVKHGWNGLLADPSSPSDLVLKIRMILDDPILVSHFRNNGLTTVRGFSMQRCVDETLDFYRECIS